MFIKSTKKAEDDVGVPERASRRKSLKRAVSAHISRAGILFKGNQKIPDIPNIRDSSQLQRDDDHRRSEQKKSSDVGGPRFYGSGTHEPDDGVRRAGEPSVYQTPIVSLSFLPIGL
jgi:hypothetical protein